MLWTRFSFDLLKSRSQWHSYGIWHCPIPWCTNTLSLVILQQIT